MHRTESADNESTTEDEDDASDRPTVPFRRNARVHTRPPPIRIALVQAAFTAVTLDLVVADLSRDPRSEYCYDRPSGISVVATSTILPRAWTAGDEGADEHARVYGSFTVPSLRTPRRLGVG
jgi:hypothetical protein